MDQALPRGFNELIGLSSRDRVLEVGHFSPKKTSTIVYMADLDDPFLAAAAAAAAPSLEAVVLSLLFS